VARPIAIMSATAASTLRSGRALAAPWPGIGCRTTVGLGASGMGVSSCRLAQASLVRRTGRRPGQAALSRGEALGSPGRRMFGELVLFVGVGFAAELIDGAIGMA
jgi:hypothetical protein